MWPAHGRSTLIYLASRQRCSEKNQIGASSSQLAMGRSSFCPRASRSLQIGLASFASGSITWPLPPQVKQRWTNWLLHYWLQEWILKALNNLPRAAIGMWPFATLITSSLNTGFHNRFIPVARADT